MLRTYKYRIYPTKEQSENINTQMFSCARLYNKMLKQRIDLYKKKGISISQYTQHKQIPLIKDNKKQYKDIHSQVLQKVITRLDISFKNFFRRVKKGEKPGFPRFKSPRRYNTLEYKQSGFKILDKKENVTQRIKLSKIGEVKLRKHRELPNGGKVKTLSITKNLSGKYYVTLVVETEDKVIFNPNVNKKVGIDLGINYIATLSDGVQLENPKHIRKQEKKLKRLQRNMSRRKKGSNNRRKYRSILAKQHEKLTNSRKDYLHKITKILINTYGLIVLENLNVKGMVKNHHLAKSISDVAWGRLLTLLGYKAESAGTVVELVDPKYTSQDCYNCGQRVKKTLATRIHKCECGYIEDRDINASKNILKKGLGQLAEKY